MSKNKQIRTEILQGALKYLLSSSMALLLIILVIVFALWNITSHISLLIWFVSIVIIILIRLLHAKSSLKNFKSLSLSKIEREFKLLALLTVSTISLGVLLFTPNDITYQSFVTMMLAGLSAGSVMSLSFYKRVVVSYISILLVPFIALLLLQGGELKILTALLISFYIVMLSKFSTIYHKNIVSLIVSKLKNEDAQKEIQCSKDLFTTVFEQAPVGVFTYDKNLIINSSNEAFASLLKVQVYQLINLDMKVLPDQSIRYALDAPLGRKKGFYEGKYHTKLSGIDIWISMQTAPLYDTEHVIQGGLGIVMDITQRVHAEEKIRYQAYYDHLTGLANRLMLQDRLEQQIAKLSRHHHYGALIFIDLDHFKTINDSLGHDVGDEILKEFSHRMLSIVRKEDTVARLGGDEFVLLLPELKGTREDATQLAYQIAQKCHKLMETPIKIREHTLHVTLSQGITIIGDKNEDISTILKNADIAMYEAKKAGRANSQFYEESMTTLINQRLELDNDLRRAIKEEEFELYFQPIVDTDTQEVFSCEALIRWKHPTKGLIPPDMFIPFAEESGLIIPIGNWVIKAACETYLQWDEKIQKQISGISINISPKQFIQDEFTDYLLSTLNSYSLDFSLIKLELTESVIVNNMNKTVEKLKYLQSLGFIMLMDDFGTGYSSLSYLKNLPFNFIKIDRSFMQHVIDNREDASLVKVILSISEQFGFKVIAEGVEEHAQVEFLKSINCHYFQGYYISKPLSSKEFTEFLNK